MKKFNEIISLNSNFKPWYDISEEIDNYWKSFIPTNKFYSLLFDVLNSVDSNTLKDKKSLWVQGTYGTGKSHATGVIKHLLFDDLDEISDYIDQIDNQQLKMKLKNFRENHKVFPVVLKGISGIINNSTFALEIELEVQKALLEKDISITTQTDIELLINKIEINSMNIDWDKNIQNSPSLSMYVSNKNELISKLKENDKAIFEIVKTTLSDNGVIFAHENIEEWLCEILKELKEKSIADKIILYWDEFTSILEMKNGNTLLSRIQSIAELSSHKDIYLFIVSHRMPEQAEISQEDLEKIFGRFKTADYSMEPITSYHIIGSAIRKDDQKKWISKKDKHVDELKNITLKISKREGANVSGLLANLYPIHPYTAYLATFFSRVIGSTERSVFNFLHDNNNGFLYFINNNPDPDGNVLLTPDYLFNFFIEDFGNSKNLEIKSILEKYKLHSITVKNKNQYYLNIFKGVLLLNILYKYVNVSESEDDLIKPNKENILLLFVGTKNETVLEDCLDWFNEYNIIPRNPDQLYLIESSNLSIQEIERTKLQIINQYQTIDKVLSSDNILNLETSFLPYLYRENKIIIVDSNLNIHQLRNKITTNFSNNYRLNIVLVLNKTPEINGFITSIKLLIDDEDLQNIIFVISNSYLGKRQFEKYIEYQAKAVINNRYEANEDKQVNIDYAEKITSEFITNWKNSLFELYLISGKKILHKNQKYTLDDLRSYINQDISPYIFSNGLENIKCQGVNFNLWKMKRTVTKVSEIYLFNNTLNELEEATRSNALNQNTKLILKDNNGQYIVNDRLEFNSLVDPSHPLFAMYKKINDIINKNNSNLFNLGDTLKFLCEPPFGLYSSMLGVAAISFCLRPFIGKLYSAGTGRIVEKEIMRDIVSYLFEYFERERSPEKLEVRLGIPEERELIEKLSIIFNINNTDSLNDVKWKIRNWVKSEVKFPLWVFKFENNITQELVHGIEAINIFLESTDNDFTSNDIIEMEKLINNIKTDLSILFKGYNKAKDLFIKWLKLDKNLKIKDEQNDLIIEYVREHMSEEIGVASWREEKVLNVVKDYFLVKPQKVQARFSYKIVSNAIPQQIIFIDESEGNPTSWEWEIEVNGRKSILNERHPSYHCETHGTHNVRLRVKDDESNISETEIESIIIKGTSNNVDKIDSDNIINRIRDYDGDIKNLLIQIIIEEEAIIKYLKKYFI